MHKQLYTFFFQFLDLSFFIYFFNIIVILWKDLKLTLFLVFFLKVNQFRYNFKSSFVDMVSDQIKKKLDLRFSIKINYHNSYMRKNFDVLNCVITLGPQ